MHAQSYLQMIVTSADIQKGDAVLEVGPGDGALTRVLLAAGAKVHAVEKDARLIPILKEKFAKEIAEGTLAIIEDDVLQFHIWNYLQEGETYKLVANIPYYITGAILEKFLSAEHKPHSMTLLVQKEVAERIARDKKESILSLSVKAYGEPRYVKTVPAGAFSPPPKVDSAILSIENISGEHFTSAAHEKKFFEILHKGFAHKRKLLARNLEPLFGKEYSHILKNMRIDEKARAEDVPLEKWLSLANFTHQETQIPRTAQE